MDKQPGSVLGGSLLIAGTSIGGGMLALPVVTSMTGFAPSLLVFFVCYLAMMATGLLYLEICLYMGKETNIISMAKATLGKGGALLAWVIYLFFFYCLTLAYINGGGNLIRAFAPFALTDFASTSLFVLFFGFFVFLGAKAVDRINGVLMLGLLGSFLAFAFFGLPEVQPEYLARVDWNYLFIGLPICIAGFGYQGIVPTLVTYMNRDVAKLRLSIVIGTTLPLLTYLLWQILILGTIPFEGVGGLKEAFLTGSSSIVPETGVKWIGALFGFCALVTSFLGVTLGLLDFMADGLKIKKTPMGRLLLCLLIYLPPFALSLGYERIFLIALDYAGTFGGVILLGLMPVAMVVSLRYFKKSKEPVQLPGGAASLALLGIFLLFILLHRAI